MPAGTIARAPCVGDACRVDGVQPVELRVHARVSTRRRVQALRPCRLVSYRPLAIIGMPSAKLWIACDSLQQPGVEKKT